MGEDMLAEWLLSPSPLERIRQRHVAVSELRDQLDLREDLAVLGEDAAVGVHPDALLKWAESPNLMKPLWIRWLSPVLAALAISATVLWAVWNIATPLVLIVVIEAVLTYALKRPLEEVLHGTEHAFRDLDLLSGVLARIEAHTFQAPRLHELQQALLIERCPRLASHRASQDASRPINSRHNIFVRIIDAPLMYSVQVAFAAERWRQAHGGRQRLWIDRHRRDGSAAFAGDLQLRTSGRPVSRIHGRRRQLSMQKSLGIRLSPRSLCSQQRKHPAARRGFCWSAAPTCQARARCCAPLV